MTTPATNQPIDASAEALTEAELSLTEFERAFVFSGTRAEFNRASKLVLPIVNAYSYSPLLEVCECSDLEIWKVSGSGRSWFYGVCHAHRLQPLGRAIRDGGLSDSRRIEARRKSGYTTERWHRARRIS